ncbi:MAG TPA: hypothetical protein DIT25_04500 [Candidatus Moranbacteria bacterium]|nr:hypothetical protein [Candidatus Moranbacteria bacterium]
MSVIRKFHERSKIFLLKNTSVVSPLFSGQFCYCLDEIQWYKKYGDLVKVEIGDDFQKIQPAIRIRDFEAHYLEKSEGLQHLGIFSLATVSGGRVVAKDEAREKYAESVKSMLEAFFSLSLDLSRLEVTYFSGNTAANVEMSRKKEAQKRRILVDDYIPEDDFKSVLIECGLKEEQLRGISTRDNYLTTNWFNCVAPWGYRNEFLYRMSDGAYVDIGTIERLNVEPIIEEINEERYVVSIKEWEKSIVINAIGIERVSMCLEEKKSISDISQLAPLKNLLKENGVSSGEINRIREALRILHRIFTDVDWAGLGKHKDRKNHVKSLMRICNALSLETISDFLHLHAELYKKIFPDLRDGIARTVEEIKNYRLRVK